MLTSLKSYYKVEYFKRQFSVNKYNQKATWKLIGSLIRRKTKSQTFPTRLSYNNKMYTNKLDIVNQFNDYFINIGQNLTTSNNDLTNDPTQYFPNNTLSSFVFSEISRS